MLQPLIKTALGYTAATFLNDAFRRPRSVGQEARQYCDAVRKPLLLIHDGGIVATAFGQPVKAEVVRRTAYPVPVAGRVFGAVVAVGVIERLKNPGRALAEWRRVADRVFVVTPSWYAPATWLNPEHRWFVDPGLQTAIPLWQMNRTLRPLSDTRYGPSRWNPRKTPPSPAPRKQPPRQTTHQTTPLPSQWSGSPPWSSPQSAPRMPGTSLAYHESLLDEAIEMDSTAGEDQGTAVPPAMALPSSRPSDPIPTESINADMFLSPESGWTDDEGLGTSPDPSTESSSFANHLTVVSS